MVFAETVKSIWDRLSRIGVSPDIDPRQAKHIVLVNRMAVTIMLMAGPIAVFAQFAGLWLQNLSSLGLQFGMASVLLLNRMGRTYASRVCYMVSCYLSLVVCIVLVGMGFGTELYFFNTALSALFFFGKDERKTLIAAVSAGPLCYAILVWPNIAPMTRIPPSIGRVILSVNILTSFFIFLLEFLYFFAANLRTERALAEAMEAAKTADKAKSQFLAGISHEIRTPLNGILGLSELVAGGPLPKAQLESVQTIRSSAIDLLDIINDILDISKIEAGRMQLEHIPFLFAPVRDSLQRLFQPQADRKALRWTATIDPAVPDRLMGDPVRLKQILTNLIGNAFKFTETGSVTLRVSMAAPLEENMARIEFTVADTGIGIPPEAQKKLFQAFLQADASTTRKYGGTGLGLHLSKELVERMGGSIGFHSEPGKGSRFFFSAPFALAPAQALSEGMVEQGPDPRLAALKALPRPRVLIVEDHPVNQKVLAAMLAQFGWSARIAANGVEALQALAGASPDIIFMDSHMPEMDGIDCTRALRELEAGGVRAIIIGVTADAMAGSREKCLQAGMDEMITKPIQTRDLLAVITRLWTPEAAEGARGRKAGFAEAERREEEWTDAAIVESLFEWMAAFNPGFWNTTMQQFEASYRKIVARIRQECEAGRFHDAGEEAHGLKGACATLGFWRMAEVCAGLEALGLGGDTSSWPELLARLEQYREPSLAEINKKVKLTLGF